MPDRLVVDLVRAEGTGEWSTSIYATVTEEGDVQVAGQTLGAGASLTGGDGTEFIASVEAKHKDRLLLALIEKVYGGNPEAVNEFHAFAKSRGIPAGWFRWP